MLKDTIVITAGTLLSRVFGLIRDMLMGAYFGASSTSDAFWLAFKLPNFLRRFLAEGALASTFQPLFIEKYHQDKGLAYLFARKILLYLTIALTCIITIGVAIFPWLLPIAFYKIPSTQMDQVIILAQIMLPYIGFISAAAFLGAILNSEKKFAPFAIMPLWLNIVWILALILLPTNVDNLAISILIAGIIQLLWIIYGLYYYRVNIFYDSKPYSYGNVKTRIFLKRFFPVALSAGVLQLNVMIDIFFAATLEAGSISYLHYADRMVQLPFALIGISLSHVVLTHISHAIANNNARKSNILFSQAIIIGFAISIAATAGLIMLAPLIIAVLFGYGEFNDIAVINTASILEFLALALPAYVLYKVFTTLCYAKGHLKPIIPAAIIAIGCNVSCNIILIPPYGVNGLAMATAISAWSSCLYIMLASPVDKSILFEKILTEKLWLILLKCLIACACMVITLAITLAQLPQIMIFTNNQYLLLGCQITIGTAIFVLISYILGIGRIISNKSA
jgi:putative peptidoglycan lipid II flippase